MNVLFVIGDDVVDLFQVMVGPRELQQQRTGVHMRREEVLVCHGQDVIHKAVRPDFACDLQNANKNSKVCFLMKENGNHCLAQTVKDEFLESRRCDKVIDFGRILLYDRFFELLDGAVGVDLDQKFVLFVGHLFDQSSTHL